MGVEIRQGPGCPVCVTTPKEIEEAILLSKKGKKLVVFGDMIKVPGASGSLSEARAGGGDVQIAYGVDDAVKIAYSLLKDLQLSFVHLSESSYNFVLLDDLTLKSIPYIELR